MDAHTHDTLTGERFWPRIEAALAPLALLAPAWDASGTFAAEGLGALREAGALAAPLPADLGGRGLGTLPAAWREAFELLRRLGRVSASLGRVYEGHVNALRLVMRYGTRMQKWQAAADARAGHLFAIWAAESRTSAVTLKDGVLRGRKAFASAAHNATRALITAHVPGEGECLVLVPMPAHDAEHGGEERAGPPFDLHGVRSAGTAPVGFEGIAVSDDARIGAPGDYMREPEISLGAWRPLAVQFGTLEALIEALRADLVARQRTGDPHQLARFGQVLIAEETARLWVERAAEIAEREDADADDAANYVKLARVAVETVCMDTIALTQRSAGLAAFVRPNPIERIARDLATYLRQPALDMVLDEAAAFYIVRPGV